MPKYTLAAIIFAGIFFAVPELRSQAISGDLVGIVTDVSGATAAKAEVTALNVATGMKSSVLAGQDGEYRISNLPPGTYDVSASLTGFTAATLKNVPVQLNQTVTANFTLQVASVSTAVDVTEATSVIDTTTTQIQNTYSTRQASDLPAANMGSGILNLSLLAAGVGTSGGIGVGTGPSVGGQRPRNNNFTVEGVDDNQKSTTGPTVVIPNESVAEFTLLQNQFQAEYGHSSGGQFNTVVKSGTNRFHSTLYEYLENRQMNALDETFAHQGTFRLPRLDQNHLGGNFGGPIRKDRLFFFASFEYNPLGRASTSASPTYAPTAAGYTTLAGVPGVSKTNLGVMQQYAVAPAVTSNAPNIVVNGVTVPTGIIPIVAPNYTNAYFGVLSLDYNISSNDQIRGRYIWNKTDAINIGARLPAFYTTQQVNADLFTLAEYHTFTPHLTNEFRLGYSRFNSTSPVGGQTFAGLDAFPNLQFNDLSLQLGPNPSFPQETITNLYSGTENITWLRGNHTFKFGTEFRDSIAPEQFSQRLRGDYEYTKVANYLLDQNPDFLAQRNIGSPIYYGNQLATYSYLQDTWRMRPDLTLDLGLRYEYTTVPLGMQAQKLNAMASVPGVLTFHAPAASPYAIGPRAGVAYTPDKSGNTVIRAGFGIAYDVIFDNVGLNSVPPEFATTVNAPASGSNFLANGAITQSQGLASRTPAAERASTSSYLPDQELPYAINWNIGVQHVFARDYTLEVRYLGTRGVHLIQQEQLNQRSLVSPQQNIPTFVSIPSAATLASLPVTVGQLRSIGSLIPFYGSAGFTSTITEYVPTGWSFYNGLSVQLNRRFANGFQYQAAYTWSHNIDNSTAEVASTYLTPRRAQDFADLSAEKASSALDRRQRLVLSMIYEVPFYRHGRNQLLKYLVAGWELAPVFTYESPEWFTVQSGLDSNLNGDSTPDRTIVNPQGVGGAGSGVIGLDRNGIQIQPTAPAGGTAADPVHASNNIVAYVAVNPNARYIQAGPGAYANGGRNTEPGRPIDNIDFSLIKHFRIGERYRLDLAGQAFNLFNHPQYVPGQLSDVRSTNTFNNSSLAYVSVANPLFNDPTYAFSSSPRVLQVTAKFNW